MQYLDGSAPLATSHLQPEIHVDLASLAELAVSKLCHGAQATIIIIIVAGTKTMRMAPNAGRPF